MLEALAEDEARDAGAVRTLELAGPAGVLEVLHAGPGLDTADAPVVFVHGAYTAAWVWVEHFLPWFAARGVPALALSLRGHGASDGADRLDASSLGDYVDDLVALVDVLPRAPFVVGHSMGGMVVQAFLRRRTPRGAVLMASVPPWGLGATCAELAWRAPGLLLESATVPHRGPAGISGEAMAAALFSRHLDPRRRARYVASCQRESPRVLLDMLGLDLPWSLGPPATPMLVLGASGDDFFGPHTVRATALAYAAAVHVFDGVAHAMMLDPDWERVAARLDAWRRGVVGAQVAPR